MDLVSQHQEFGYRNLTGADSFRLLLLQPAPSHGSDLHCQVLHARLSECDRDIIDQYTALSYVWSDPGNTGEIYVDGILFVITATLDAALRDLRDKTRVLRVWTDVLCIDQSNLTERASQVGLVSTPRVDFKSAREVMAQIYSIAHHTVIHLGSLTAEKETILKAAPSNTSGTVGQDWSRDSLVEIAENTLLRAAWFSRVWVFQELVLSRDPWVQCGTVRARWTELCHLLVSTGHDQTSTALQILRGMDSSRGPARLKLLVLLTSRRGLGATDPRDLIYANMGISSDLRLLRESVQVDYWKTCEELYEEVARYLLDNIGPEGPTVYFPHVAPSECKRRGNLASWAPDWSVPAQDLVAMCKDNNIRKLQLQSKAHYAFLGKPLTLAWVGYQVDVIASFSVGLPDPIVLDTAARQEYQQAVRGLDAMYARIWWSGDEFGQHQHVHIKGKEAEHEKLCRVSGNEWLQILDRRSPQMEGENQGRFLAGFGQWLNERAPKEIIMTGRGSGGLAALMYYYLHPRRFSRVLTGRKLAITRDGRVAVVPRDARKGDMLVHVAGPLVSLILRQDLECQIREEDTREALKAKNRGPAIKAEYVLPDMAKIEFMKIKHCTLVGECYIDGDVGWSLHEERLCEIYALHK